MEWDGRTGQWIAITIEEASAQATWSEEAYFAARARTPKRKETCKSKFLRGKFPSPVTAKFYLSFLTNSHFPVSATKNVGRTKKTTRTCKVVGCAGPSICRGKLRRSLCPMWKGENGADLTMPSRQWDVPQNPGTATAGTSNWNGKCNAEANPRRKCRVRGCPDPDVCRGNRRYYFCPAWKGDHLSQEGERTPISLLDKASTYAGYLCHPTGKEDPTQNVRSTSSKMSSVSNLSSKSEGRQEYATDVANPRHVAVRQESNEAHGHYSEKNAELSSPVGCISSAPFFPECHKLSFSGYPGMPPLPSPLSEQHAVNLAAARLRQLCHWSSISDMNNQIVATNMTSQTVHSAKFSHNASAGKTSATCYDETENKRSLVCKQPQEIAEGAGGAAIDEIAIRLGHAEIAIASLQNSVKEFVEMNIFPQEK
jgi:hypothetical protein